MQHSNIYDSNSLNIQQLAHVLMNLSKEQQEALEILLDPEAVKQIEESFQNIKQGRTISIDEL